MQFAYLDESGDAGAAGSKYIILTLMCTSRKKEVVKIIRDVKSRLLRKHKCARWLNRHGGEIKYYGFPDIQLLQDALQALSKLNIHVYYVAFDKGGCQLNSRMKEFIIPFLFMHIIQGGINDKPVKIIADVNFFNNQKINRFLLRSFYITESSELDNDAGTTKPKISVSFEQISDEKYSQIKEDPPKLMVEIEHQNSRLVEELQALDLIGGTIFRALEHGNADYLGILNSSKTMNIYGTKVDRKIIQNFRN